VIAFLNVLEKHGVDSFSGNVATVQFFEQKCPSKNFLASKITITFSREIVCTTLVAAVLSI
jgi:hypothetical protein